jgi:hypothetical protein
MIESGKSSGGDDNDNGGNGADAEAHLDNLVAALIAVFGDRALNVAEVQAQNEDNASAATDTWRKIADRIRRSAR